MGFTKMYAVVFVSVTSLFVPSVFLSDTGNKERDVCRFNFRSVWCDRLIKEPHVADTGEKVCLPYVNTLSYHGSGSGLVTS